MSDFHDDELAATLAERAGPPASAEAAFGDVTNRSAQIRRRRATVAASTTVVVAIAGLALLTSRDDERLAPADSVGESIGPPASSTTAPTPNTTDVDAADDDEHIRRPIEHVTPAIDRSDVGAVARSVDHGRCANDLAGHIDHDEHQRARLDDTVVHGRSVHADLRVDRRLDHRPVGWFDPQPARRRANAGSGRGDRAPGVTPDPRPLPRRRRRRQDRGPHRRR